MRFLFLIAILASAPTFALAEHHTLTSYPCAGPQELDRHNRPMSEGQLANGQCLPTRSVHFDQTGRVGLYVRCRAVKGGGDEYTGNCCDHLRSSDSHQFKVCEGRTNPESGLGLMLQIYKLTGPTRWVCESIDCQNIGRVMGVPWL